MRTYIFPLRCALNSRLTQCYFEGPGVEQNFGTRLVYSVFFVAWKSALQSAPQDQWLPCVAKFTLWIEDSRYRLLTLQNVCIQYRSACLTSLSLWSNFMFQSINVSPFQILSEHMFKTHKWNQKQYAHGRKISSPRKAYFEQIRLLDGHSLSINARKRKSSEASVKHVGGRCWSMQANRARRFAIFLPSRVFRFPLASNSLAILSMRWTIK